MCQKLLSEKGIVIGKKNCHPKKNCYHREKELVLEGIVIGRIVIGRRHRYQKMELLSEEGIVIRRINCYWKNELLSEE